MSGVSGQSYSANYKGETWTFKDDITYLIEDTNQNSTLDSSDVILREVNWNGIYSDFGGLPSEGGSFNTSSTSDYHKKVGIDTGSVKVYQNNGNEWVQLGTEIKGDQLWDQKGISLSLSGDGKTLAVGNPYSLNSSLNGNKPAVSVYSLVNNEWSQIANINSDVFDNFGYTTSLSSDGNLLAVGGFYGELGSATDNAGYVKIFENVDGNFTQIGDALTGDNLNGDELIVKFSFG